MIVDSGCDRSKELGLLVHLALALRECFLISLMVAGASIGVGIFFRTSAISAVIVMLSPSSYAAALSLSGQ